MIPPLHLVLDTALFHVFSPMDLLPGKCRFIHIASIATGCGRAPAISPTRAYRDERKGSVITGQAVGSRRRIRKFELVPLTEFIQIAASKMEMRLIISRFSYCLFAKP
ncbi:hypothetical protein Bcep1808_1591 [Burkholderia vietnamiensis G4]|uniref:Uncharacterized protein n=1 Tax=Burkholderia vietnamiensis (strain G4 / LMG 22486) TaxID=269482 RepID=A4JE95_BURVG|nr:hypothetical protein Bcep1808_1591 [Burkholderia vietnamiensis G4]